ncbi:hypothetical protein BLNAU_9499 [Blattamonas nauphoetae]|uniref:Uncharacterized protein n=1 Tax=Blattamonas nauphoetae TaxID=2049346 RepID=A0ABQ9XVF8_9EUKA|nr:hypothetical protein BLNAU_9499 [Blattamonas nauphoetae]
MEQVDLNRNKADIQNVKSKMQTGSSLDALGRQRVSFIECSVLPIAPFPAINKHSWIDSGEMKTLFPDAPSRVVSFCPNFPTLIDCSLSEASNLVFSNAGNTNSGPGTS